MNLLRRIFGFRWRDSGSMMFSWGEVSPRLGFSIKVFPSHTRPRLMVCFHLVWPSFYVYLPIASREYVFGEGPSWGFSFVGHGVHLYWGRRLKIVDMPWSWRQTRHEVLDSKGKWVPYVFPWKGNVEGNYDDRFFWASPYSYTLSSGVVQNVVATYYVERSELRWRALKRLPFPRRIITGIHVEFSAEIGAGTGSYKGGTVGCSYNMKRGEHPTDTLRRMERERRFT